MASPLFDLTPLITQGTLKLHQSWSFKHSNSAGGTSTYYTNNPVMNSNQIAVYFVTFTCNYGTNSTADNTNSPWGRYIASGADVNFTMINGLSGYAYSCAEYPTTLQGVYTSSGAYTGSQITHQVYSGSQSSSYPNIWVNVTCFIYTPPS